MKSTDGWQPIETAPSDGKPILVVGGYESKATIRGADGEWWRRARREGSKSVPSHWMPLPEPPQ